MPNNDLPKKNPEEGNNQNNNQQNQNPIIEIPQEYYEKLRQEEHEKAMQEQQEVVMNAENKEANKKLATITVFSFFNAILIFALFHVAYNVKDIAMLAIPVIPILGTIYYSLKNKKESVFHTSVLIGGMTSAVIAYLLCLIKKDTSDYWMHVAISCAIGAFVSFLVCSVIHTIITNGKEIKALGYIGIILFFAALVGVPYYFYSKNPEEIYKMIFRKTTEVKAETEFEFITKTLKNRYGIDFECQSTKYKTDVQKGRKISQRTCNPKNNVDIKVTVLSLAYNEGANQYIITDDYLDIVKLGDFRSNHAKAILEETSGTKVNLYIYPKENCKFIGDCAECDEYFANYKDEMDIDKQYAASSKADYSSYLNMDAKDIVNSGEFKYVINVIGKYGNVMDPSSIVNTVLSYLSKQGLKNSYGYQITIYETDDTGDTQKEIFKVTGEATNDTTFANPKVVEKNAVNNNKQEK
jgi:hypothetical protein